MRILGRNFEGGFFSTNGKEFSLKWNLKKTHLGWIVKGIIEGMPGKLEIFRIKAPQKVLAGGWQSWSQFRVIDTNNYRFSYMDPAWKYKDSPRPDIETMLSDYIVVGSNFLAGFLSSNIAHAYFTLENGYIVGWLDYFDAHFDEPIPIEPFVFLEGENVNLLLEIYASLVAKENKISFKKEAPVGWCSWYQYFLDLSWKDVLKNLELAKAYPFEVFQIDDGYESDIGDWTTAKKEFPSLEEMTQKISESGLKPGIWLAPFSVSETSRLFQQHPDWVVKENGKPKLAYKNWNKNIYALDLSNEEVLEWLRNLFSSLRKMGFEYFKIDFLFAGAIPGVRKKSITPIQAFRNGMRAIREGASDAFILGCGSPLLPSVGFVDGMRIGEDTAPYWEPNSLTTISAKHALRNALTRYFMNKKWWHNDPDCILLRSRQTKLTQEQRKLYAFTSAALNNMIIVSDDLELVDEEGKKTLHDSLKMLGGKPRVENLLGDGWTYRLISEGSTAGNLVLNIALNSGRFHMNIDETQPIPRKIEVKEDGRRFYYYGDLPTRRRREE